MQELAHLIDPSREREITDALHRFVFNSIRTASVKELMEVQGIGRKKAEGIYFWFRDKENSALLDKLLPHLNFVDSKEK